MITAIVSDLHLGTMSGIDLARRPEVLTALADALARADRAVILGDLLEMRERPAAEVLALAGPALEAIGEASAGKELVIVPGNHDHELAEPALDAARIAGAPPPGLESTFEPIGELARRVAERMPRTEVVLAYPGVWLRDDVYATHGHYLDAHLTVPRTECLLASAIARATGVLTDGVRHEVAEYEAALTPIYAFAYSVVQGSRARAVTRGGNASRTLWKLANPDAEPSLAKFAVGRLAVPAAVGAVNALGLGPFRADISAEELRRAGLRAMKRVVEALGIDAQHVIFGHTHRAGPLPGEVEGWYLPGGCRLHNTGSWLLETAFLDGAEPARNPYWPGCVTLLGDDGPPLLERALSELPASSSVPG